MTDTVQTAVVGVTGYAGAELARLLLRHPRLKGKPPVFGGRVDEKDAARGGVPLAEIHPELADSAGSGALKQEPFSWELLQSRGVEVLFLATPHEQSRKWVPEALKRGLRVIDLSGAWRLNEAANRAAYAFEDEGSELAAATQAQAIYGMPELHRARIAGARLIANPGCYTTSIILALRPQHPSTHSGAQAQTQARRRGHHVLHPPLHRLPAPGRGEDLREQDLLPGRGVLPPAWTTAPRWPTTSAGPRPSRSCSASPSRAGPCTSGRMLNEFNRLASHLIWLATHGLDIGAMTVFIFREREAILDLFEAFCWLPPDHHHRLPHRRAARGPPPRLREDGPGLPAQ